MPTAKRVFFPLDRQLVIHDKHWSEGVVRQAVKLSGRMPYADAAETLQEMGQICISPSSVWRLTQSWGAVLKEQETQETHRPTSREWVERLSASLDGALVYVLCEGWKEFKVGTISEVEEESVLNPITLEEEPQSRAKQTSYGAALRGYIMRIALKAAGSVTRLGGRWHGSKPSPAGLPAARSIA